MKTFFKFHTAATCLKTLPTFFSFLHTSPFLTIKFLCATSCLIFTVLRPAESHRSQGSAVMDSQGLCLKLVETISSCLKGSPDQSHFIFEINVGKRRIRHNTSALKLNESRSTQNRLKIQIQNRSMSDPTLSVNDSKMT